MEKWGRHIWAQTHKQHLTLYTPPAPHTHILVFLPCWCLFTFLVNCRDTHSHSSALTSHTHTHLGKWWDSSTFELKLPISGPGHKIPLRIISLNHKIPCDKGNIWQPTTSPLPPLPPFSPSPPAFAGRLQWTAHPLWCERSKSLTLLRPGRLTPVPEGITMLTL